jgi:NarL family two-component system response regulator LiaR
VSAPLRVLLADDHAIVRKGIRALLATEPDIAVVGEAINGEEAVAATVLLRPDVVVLDLLMPGIDGLEAIGRIRKADPAARILVLTSIGTDEKIFPAIQAGARGYVLKDTTPEELVAAIKQVARGESSLHPAVARRVMQQLAHPPQTTTPASPLTEREIAVLRLVARGLSNQEIAASLHISEPTARTHVSNMLTKLHLASRTQAALYALRAGLASLDEDTFC